jgi:hypothetical protein
LTAVSSVLQDPVEESRRILAAAEERGLLLRAVGGIAVALRAPSVRQLDPPRTYHDIDFATRGGSTPAVSDAFVALGYRASERFNKLNGSERLLFHDPGGRRIDVFVDRLRMCHTLEFGDRLGQEPLTVTLADLALSKLQIVEMTARDGQDLLALFADHPLVDARGDGIDTERIVAVCSTDWSWWRTVTDNLRTLRDRWTAGQSALERLAAQRAISLDQLLDEAPKSLAWRMRARLGAHKRWYDLPEEVR